MPWSGGVFNRLNGATGWVDDANAFIGIEATRHDTQDNDFRDGINNTLAKDGSNAATGNLNIGSYRLTAVAAATARTDAAQVGQVQDGDYIWLGTTTGTATAQTATATPAITAYKAGQKFRMKVGTGLGSTGSTRTAHTLNINGIGAKNIKRQSGQDPTLGVWLEARIMELVYDGTNFVMTNYPTGLLSYTPTLTPLAGSATSVTAAWSHFYKFDDFVFLTLTMNWTQNTASTTSIYVTLPVQPAGSSLNMNGSITVNGSSQNAFGLVVTSPADTIRIYGSTQGNILTGANGVTLNGFYSAY